MTCKLTYTQLLGMRQSALWAAETWEAQSRNFETVGAFEEALRYWKIFNRVERAMRTWPAVNEFKK